MDELQHERVATVTLPAGASANGRLLSSFEFSAIGVRVVSLRRRDTKVAKFKGDTALSVGDTLVLSGKAEALALAEQHLLKV